MKKVRVGIVGVGNIGTVHAQKLAKIPGVEVAALCDTDAARLSRKAAEFGVSRAFADHRKMLAAGGIDAVFVCTPNAHHCPQTVAALEAGCHVLCEKPMALDAREAARMVAAARKARRVLQIGMAWRQNPAAEIVREMVRRGDLGEIYHLRVAIRFRRNVPGLGGWFTTRKLSGGGALMDIGVHFLDLAMHLADAWCPERVSAAHYGKFGKLMDGYHYVTMWAGPPRLDGVCDVDDYATGFVRFRNGPTMGFDIAWAANNKQESFIELLGDKGGVRAFGDEPLTVFTEVNGRIADVLPAVDKSVNIHERQAAKFIDLVRGRGRPFATGEEGVAVMKLLGAIYESGKTGREVVIEPPKRW